MESWRGEKMSEVEIIAVVIVPISALYYKIHTISILQVRKLVIQVTSTSTSTSRKTCTTSYKYKYKYNLQVAKNRPQIWECYAARPQLHSCKFACHMLCHFTWMSITTLPILARLLMTFVLSRLSLALRIQSSIISFY